MTKDVSTSFSEDLKRLNQMPVAKPANGNGGDNTLENLTHISRMSVEACRQAAVESANKVLEAARELEEFTKQIQTEAEETALLIKQRGDALASKVEAGYTLTGKTLAMVRDIRRLHEGG